MTAHVVTERAGTLVLSPPPGGWFPTAGATAPYRWLPEEQWSDEAVVSAAAARAGRAVVDRALQQVERKARLLETRARLGVRRSAVEERRWQRLCDERRHLEQLEAALARVVRRYEDQQALRLVRP